MPKRTMPLTDLQINKAKPREKNTSYLMVEGFF